MMRIKVDLSTFGQTKWHDYAVRFLFGGLITALAGIIAKKFGPGIGGLFLAFPAIFPASATLIEKHESEKKKSHGLTGLRRGRAAASIDAAGASIGSIGLLVFAFLVWQICNQMQCLGGARGFDAGMADVFSGGLADSQASLTEECAISRSPQAPQYIRI